MRLDRYRKGDYTPGRSLAIQILWYLVGHAIVSSRWLISSRVRCAILRAFGARIGVGVVIKPGVRIKFPWRLSIGNFSWIGEDCWLDNLAHIAIGAHCCISQGSYLCTGDHDRASQYFDLRPRSIIVADHVWIGAKVNVAPGSQLPEGAMVSLGSLWKGRGEPWSIYEGVPAVRIKKRDVKTDKLGQRILLLNQNFYPDQSATSQYLTDLAQGLCREGHDVTVVASRFGYLDPSQSYAISEQWQGITISRVGWMRPYKSNFALRVISALAMNFAFACKLLSLPRFDSVVVLTSPPLIAWVALVCLKRPRIRFSYWVMDLNPDQAIAAGKIAARSWIGYLLTAVLRRVLSRCDHVIALDGAMRDRLLSYQVPPRKLSEIPLWVDPGIRPVARDENPFVHRHNLAGKFVVMYSGNMSPCNPLDAMIAAAEKAREDMSTLFLFVGGGAECTKLRALAASKRLSNVMFLDYQDKNELSFSLSSADLHIVSHGGPFVGMVHPSKIYSIVAANRPTILLGPEDSFINRKFVTRGVGARVDIDDADALLQAIRKYRFCSPETKDALQHAINQCADEFRRERVLPRLIAEVTAS